MWNPFTIRSSANTVEDAEFQRQKDELLGRTPIPCLWLLGKTGSGKTSVVRYLTGAADAVIGDGFRPQTRTSRLFSFPDEETPIVRFLDTRGFGEAGYNPSEDVAAIDETAHLAVVTVRATDQAVADVVGPLSEIRRAKPERPVLLVITCLHDAYPGRQHPLVDPAKLGADLPETLHKCLQAHFERFHGLYDRVVVVDLTPPEEGFEIPDFGGRELKQAVLELLPAAYRQTLLQMDELCERLGESHQKRALPIILGYSALAATAAAVPVPWVDVPVVMALQSRLVHRLAQLYSQPVDKKTMSQVSFAVGGRLAVRMALREMLKFIPWVGVAANAAAAFGLVYASGRAWNWYFQQVRQGHVPTAPQLEQTYREQLLRGAKLWDTTHEEPAA